MNKRSQKTPVVIPDHTVSIGKEAGTDRIWLSQKLGGEEEEVWDDLSLIDLSRVALEMEALGDDKAAEFAYEMIERIEHSALTEAVEASRCFPGTLRKKGRA